MGSDASLRERYLGIVLAAPRDGFAMDRLLSLYRSVGDDLLALDAALTEYLSAHPEAHLAVELVRARVDRERGALVEARRRYQAVLASDANNWIAELGLTTLAQGRGDLAEAREHLSAAAHHAPSAEREELLRSLGELCLDLGDFDAAAASYAELGRGARSIHLRSEFARALAVRGEHERAIEAYRGLAAQVVGDRRVHVPLLVEIARSELALGRLDGAIETLAQARERAPASAGVRGEIVELLLDAHRRQGSLDTLAEEWSSARGSDELLARARALDELGRDEDAAAAYRRAAATRSRDPEPRLGEIRVLLRTGRIEEAITAYRALLRIAPRPQHVVALAELLEAHGRRDEALTIADALLRTARASDVATLDALAGLFSRWHEEERAARALSRRAELSPADPVPLVALGDQLLASGDVEGALRAFRRILTLGGDAASLHATLGGVYLDHDRVPDAVTELETAIRLRSDAGREVELETLRLLAMAQERAGDEARTEAAWTAVLHAAAAPSSAGTAREAREHITASWARARTLDAHLRALRVDFEGDPPDLDAGRFLVEALRRRRDLEGAVTALRRLDELAPGDVASLELLERLEVQRGDPRGAIDALARLARAEPRRAASRYRRMAEHALTLYQDEEAIGYARRAVELAPDESDGWLRLSELQRAQGDTDGAIASLRRAAELDERRYELALQLAQALITRGERSEAETLLLRVVSNAPDDALVTQAVRATLDLHGIEGGDLGALESALLGQVLRAPERVALRRAFIDLLHARVAPLAARMDGDPARAAELARLVNRGLAPLLLAIASTDPMEASAAIDLVRLAHAEGAAGALLVRAERPGDLTSRLEALAALAPLVGPGQAPRLTALIRGSAGAPSDSGLRAMATWALGRALGSDPVALERALVPLLADPDREVSGFAALALSGTGRASTTLRTAALHALEGTGAELPLVGWAFARLLATEVASRFGTPGDAASPLVFAALARTELEGPQRWLLGAMLGPLRETALAALRAEPSLPDGMNPRPSERAAAFLRRALGSRSLNLEDLSTPLQQVLLGALTRGEDEALLALRILIPARDGEGRRCIAVEGLSTPLNRSGACLPQTVLVSLESPLSALTDHASPDVRARATALLAASARSSDVTLFAAALADPSPAVLREALRARAATPIAPPLAAVLIDALLHHREWSIRSLAATSVGQIPLPDAEDALRHVVLHDAYALVRDAAARALIARPELQPDTRSALIEVGERDPEARVRRTVTDFLTSGRE